MVQKRKQFIALSKLIVLSFIVLFCLFPLVNTNTIVSSITKLFKADNEVELDNWEISTVFYDSTVNDGKTPLTEINWDASDGGYGDGEQRTVTVQINYKNTNTKKDYNPGDLKLTVKNLIYGTYDKPENKYFDSPITSGFIDSACRAKVILGANDKNHTNYEWNYEDLSYDSNSNNLYLKENLLFYNAHYIEKNSNFEGSIQIQFLITPLRELQDFDNLYHYASYYTLNFPIEPGLDDCDHNYNKQITANLFSFIDNDYILNKTTNTINYNYHRKYTHTWQKVPYQIKKTANKVLTIEGLPDNYNDYIWVKYDFEIKSDAVSPSFTYKVYPNLHAQTFRIKDTIDEECIVLDSDYNVVNNDYSFEFDSPDHLYKTTNYGSTTIVVGYPKNKYNAINDNLDIENEVKLFAKYPNYSEFEYQDLDTINVNLNSYNIGYSGDLYHMSKEIYSGNAGYYGSHNQDLYYQSLIGQIDGLGKDGTINYSFPMEIIYTGKKLDVKFGDDLLYITDINSNYRRLKDDEYYFSKITIPTMYSGIGKKVIYKMDLYVRYANSNEYEFYKTFNENYCIINFPENQKVVGWYAVIKDINSSILFERKSLYETNYDRSDNIKTNLIIKNANNIPKSGTIYNFNYMQVFNNGELLNPADESVYNSFNDIDDIKQIDLEQFGNYIERSSTYVNYKNYDISNVEYEESADKKMSYFIQDAGNQEFTGTATITGELYMIPQYSDNVYNSLYEDSQYKYEDGINKFDFYDLLPLGMKLTSSKEDILNSIGSYVSSNTKTYNQNKKLYSKSELSSIFKSNSSVEIINNWKDTGRTYIHVSCDLTDHPLYSFNYYILIGLYGFKYDYSVSYDDYFEYGTQYSNTVYFQATGNVKHNHGFKKDELDINMNGSTDDYFSSNQYDTNTATIMSVISTHQDVQVSVQSDKSNYDTGKVDTSNDSDYYYKLRARTGSNDVTNLVIYDSLEKYAKDPNMANVLASGGRGSWQGEFLGIDTSYAESKGYTVKTYYSENEEVGNLKDDDSWKEYNDSVDKSKVKSLAFEYLDESGKPAVLPANSLTYVLIKMKSPADENIKTLAYNGCWTEWNAIDPITGDKVDFITGINSNIVKVALPNSVEPVDIDFRVDKYWKDNNNEKKLRPDSVNLQVVPDGDVTQAIDVPLGSTNVDDSDSNHWYTTIRVPKYDNNGNTIVYTVREDEILLDNGYKYTPEIEDTTITNRLMKEIKLKKIWKDNSNSELTRPSNITYKVKQNGNNYKDVVITGDYSTNEWNKIISVPVYDSSNNEYSYSIEEVNVNNYSSNCEEFSCTNTLVGTDSIHITKRWIDNNNSYDTRPDNVNVEILRNGTRYKTIQLTKDNNWEYSEEVSKYDDNGNRYSYTIEENKVDGYDLVTYNQNTYEITNTLKTNMNIVITKKWIDDNNNDNTRPSELVVTLLRNDEKYKEVTLTGDSDIWTSIVEVPKYDDNQKEYKYSIKEINDDISDYYSDITYEDDLTVINKLNKNTDLTIKKKWIDHNNEYSSRPNEVNIKLFRNNEEYKSLKLSGNDNTWESIVKDVPMYDENGKKYIYTIEEDTIDKYSKVTYDQSNLEVTNELTEIPKVTLYFTVVNGYVDPKTGKMKYDEFGLNEILKKYNKTLEDEYIFEFKLENTDTHKIYDGKLSTKGVLEFKDIPYGEYKAIVGKDKLFEFVDMLSIKDVNGVSFKKIGNEGYISIKPTGDNIVFGAKIINKIVPPVNNPKTGINIIFIIAFVLLIPIIVSKMIVKNRKVLDSY